MKLFTVPEPQRLHILYRFLNGRSAARVRVQLPQPEELAREGQPWVGFWADIGHNVEESLFFLKITPMSNGGKETQVEYTINLSADGAISQVLEKVYAFSVENQRKCLHSWSQWVPNEGPSGEDAGIDLVVDVLAEMKLHGQLEERVSRGRG